MPKYCSVPNCRNDSGSGSDRKSFYKFPLQDPVRLQQWLRNMGRESWTPSRHQYICHEHFAPSCFKVRWGIRYLESDAVPTLFQEAEKRKATDHSEKKPKRLRSDGNESVAVSDDKQAAVDAVETESTFHTVHLYEITVDPSQPGETSLVEATDVGGSDCSLQTDLNPSVDRFETGGNFPLTLFQTVNDLSNSGENTEVVVMSECPAGEGQDELVNGITAAILTQGHGLVMRDSTLGCMDETVASLRVEDVTCTTEGFSEDHEGHETQVIAYFEAIPNVFPSETSTHFTFSPDTVLSSALSSKPITSTLPIVSKHVPPSPTSLVLTMERLDTEEGEGEGDDGLSEEDGTERQDHQLEEHCYHKNSLSKEQLEAIVAELQKKVKVLQQRHRRHLEKLLGLENTVSQLRQSNMLNEERLQLLERAYIQTSAGVSDAGETVTIIYEENDAAYLYTPLNNADEKL